MECGVERVLAEPATDLPDGRRNKVLAGDRKIYILLITTKGKVKCFRVPDASARMEPELNPDFPPFE